MPEDPTYQEASFKNGNQEIRYKRWSHSERGPCNDEGSPGDTWLQGMDRKFVKNEEVWTPLVEGNKMKFPGVKGDYNFNKYHPDPSDLSWRIKKPSIICPFIYCNTESNFTTAGAKRS
jgi:hypothetical protein